jgi:glycosyltransferase involved in cell wall biosynthesis
LVIRSPGDYGVVRVLQLVKTSVGAEWARLQMQKLVEHGIDVHAALPFGGPRLESYRTAGIEVHDVSFPLSPVGMATHGRLLRRVARRIRPDIIHSWFTQTTLYARTFLRFVGPPRVFQVPGPLHLESAAYRTLDVRSASRRDWWVGTSRYIVNLYRRAGVPESRLRLAYAPVDLSYYSKREPGWLRERFGIPDSKRIVGMVAYMYPPHRMLPGRRRGIKGHEDLIDAFALLRVRRDDLVLVIVGAAWGGATDYERTIRSYARDRCGSDVIFTGWLDDVRDAFADFDVFVHPPRSENLGGVFESLLLEVPTVASRAGGIPEAVLDGETGLLFEPGDHVGMARGIETMLDDPARAGAFVARGRRHILEIMDLERSIDVVRELYSDLTEEK